jgi:hypothetical protein
METEVRNCKVHGITPYRRYISGAKERWRCLKCQTDATQKRRDKLKQLAIHHKGGKCEICGYNKCIGALEFHHLDPNEKDFGIANKGYTRSWDKVKIEIDKCIMVCANCHREIHSKD